MKFRIKDIFKKIVDVKSIFIRIKKEYSVIKPYIIKKYRYLKEEIAATRVRMSNDPKEKNRILLLALSALFIFDYAVISYHIDKNIFDIFPSIPAIDSSKKINIYIPAAGCREIISEKRRIHSGLDEENLVRRLFDLVADGSYYENTSENVPVTFLIKKIWFVESENGDGRVCVIDLSPAMLGKEISVVKGSEQMFRDSLEKTVTENVPGVKRVLLLEKGVPFKKLWEI